MTKEIKIPQVHMASNLLKNEENHAKIDATIKAYMDMVESFNQKTSSLIYTKSLMSMTPNEITNTLSYKTF